MRRRQDGPCYLWPRGLAWLEGDKDRSAAFGATLQRCSSYLRECREPHKELRAHVFPPAEASGRSPGAVDTLKASSGQNQHTRTGVYVGWKEDHSKFMLIVEAERAWGR